MKPVINKTGMETILSMARTSESWDVERVAAEFWPCAIGSVIDLDYLDVPDTIIELLNDGWPVYRYIAPNGSEWFGLDRATRLEYGECQGSA